MPVPDKENYREAVCDVDRNVARCFFQSSTKKTGTKTPACREIPDHVGVIRRSNKTLCEEFAPRNEGIRLSGERGANRADQAAGEIALSGRELCEEFAPRNEDIRLSEERGANRAARAPAKPRIPAGSCVKNLLPETKG